MKRAFLCGLLLCLPAHANIDADLGIGHLNLKSVTWVYGGISSGYALLNAQVTGENRKDGVYLAVKAGTRLFQIEHWDFDFNLGWWHTAIGRQTGGAEVNITVNAALAELALRYRWTPRLFVGPSFTLYLANNGSFTESSNESKIGALFGPAIVYEYPFKSSRLRFGVEANFDFNLPNRQLMTVGATIQYGFPIRHQKQPPATTKSGAEIRSNEQKLTLYLPETYLDFEETQPSALSRKLLREIAELLSKENTDWMNLRIECHLASGKPDEANKQTAERAENILKALVFFGITTKKTESVGKGVNSPRFTTPEKIPYNARVELHLSGIKETVRLKEQLTRILYKYEP